MTSVRTVLVVGGATPGWRRRRRRTQPRARLGIDAVRLPVGTGIWRAQARPPAGAENPGPCHDEMREDPTDPDRIDHGLLSEPA